MSSSSEYEVGGIITISCCHRSKIKRYEHRTFPELSTILGELNNFISKLSKIKKVEILWYCCMKYQKYCVFTITDLKYQSFQSIQLIFKVFDAAVYRFYSLERDKHL